MRGSDPSSLWTKARPKLESGIVRKESAIREYEFATVLPSQYSGLRSKAPEEQLLIAILQDAIECVEKYRFATDAEGQGEFHAAKRWLLADERDWPCSFARICEVLDINAVEVRARLRPKLTRPTDPPALLMCGDTKDTTRRFRSAIAPPSMPLGVIEVDSGV
jgi:hypothetical protein